MDRDSQLNEDHEMFRCRTYYKKIEWKPLDPT